MVGPGLAERRLRRSAPGRDPAPLRRRRVLRLLLDTRALLWAADGSLAGEARDAVEKLAEAVFVSSATVWEIEIKRALGRLRAPDDVAGLVGDSGFTPLAITFEHAVAAGRLPALHRDPVDRMLVAQALADGLTLATADATLAGYGLPVLEATRA